MGDVWAFEFIALLSTTMTAVNYTLRAPEPESLPVVLVPELTGNARCVSSQRIP